LGSILGGIISGAIGFASAFCMSNINARRVAAERLRAAFAPELAAMRRWHADKAIDREQLLKAAFSRHAVAIEEYRPFVHRMSRDAYRRRGKPIMRIVEASGFTTTSCGTMGLRFSFRELKPF